METISALLRGAEYTHDEKHKVLERIDWLNYLKIIFNKTANDSGIRTSSLSVTVEAFLNTLIESVSDLPLMTLTEFEARSSVQTLSLEEVFCCFEAEFGRTLTWDEVMDQVMMLKRQSLEESAESPRSIDVNELVYITQHSNSTAELPVEEYPRSPRVKSDLRIPQTPPHSNSQDFSLPRIEIVQSVTLPVVTNRTAYILGRRQQPNEAEALDLSYPDGNTETDLESSIFECGSRMNLTCLSAAGSRLRSLPLLPTSLLVLNLADNSIADISPLSTLTQIQFLNLSYNCLTDLSGLQNMPKLSELLIAQNSLTKVNNLHHNLQLSLLDLSYNTIEYYEELASLVSNKMLRVLRVKGNKIREKKDFEVNLRALLPFVEVLDPHSIAVHSAYNSYGELAFSSFSLKNSFSQSLNTPEVSSPLTRSYTENSFKGTTLENQRKARKSTAKGPRVPRLSLRVDYRKIRDSFKPKCCFLNKPGSCWPCKPLPPPNVLVSTRMKSTAGPCLTTNCDSSATRSQDKNLIIRRSRNVIWPSVSFLITADNSS